MNQTATPLADADRLRAEAAQHHQDSNDSFERCDTDGFVSQWASGMMAELKSVQAKIAEVGGSCTFVKTSLVTLDGEPTDARCVETRYGKKWRLDSADLWLAYMPARESTLAKYGYREVEEYVTAPAKAFHSSPRGARGISGATSVYVRIIRDDMPDDADVWSWTMFSYTPDAQPEA